MLPMSGHHTSFIGHRLLGHTALNMRRLPTRPAIKRCVAEGNSNRGSKDEEAQIFHRPQRPKKWLQPPRQGNQRGQKGSASSQPKFFPKKSAGSAPRQASDFDRSPRIITAFIKQHKQTAIGLTKGSRPEAGLTSFCTGMEDLLCRPGLRTDYIHFSAIITAAAHIWTEAQRSPRFRAHAYVKGRLKTLFQRCLQSLQALHADMGAQAVSNVLWSSATLGFNPDDSVPGMVHALTSKFLHFIDVAERKQPPNAQGTANFLWALATLGHPAASVQVVRVVCSHFERLTLHPNVQQHPTEQACSNVLLAVAKIGHSSAAATEMVDSVCLYFARLTEHSDAQQRPTAQGCSNLLWAVATMEQHSASATEVVDSVCLRFACLVKSPIAQQRPNAQEVANVVWALGTLEHTPPDDRLLDGLCEYMRILLCNQDQMSRPNAQEIANTVWALAQLRHAPSQDVMTAMFDYFVDLCQTPGCKPDSQNISNAFIACAELGLVMKPACVEALLKHLMDMHVSSVEYQNYCNIAWNLAVMHCLDLNTFEALLDKLTTKHKLVVEDSGFQSTSAQLTAAGATQLYQALAWLRPPSGSQLMKAWSSSRLRLCAIAPEPAFRKLSTPGQTVMWAALAMYNVPYQGQMQCGVYRADALLSPHDSKAAKVILMAEQPKDVVKNVPNRVMLGSAVFRNQLLFRYGTVITIPYNPRRSTAESMADDIKAAVEAKTGLPLDSFRS